MLLLFTAATLLVVLWQTGLLDRISDQAAIAELARNLGAAGPAIIILIITLAIVMSPIPSAPVALAAGAVYGHYWGTVYIATGSVAGALIAFGISRIFGYEFVSRHLRARFDYPLMERFLGSQNALTAVIFGSRLIPFLSFDLISYAAGLTPLRTWRFVLATTAGIVPASFLLAHLGGELVADDTSRIGITVLLLGLLTGAPILARYVWKAWKRRSDGRPVSDRQD